MLPRRISKPRTHRINVPEIDDYFPPTRSTSNFISITDRVAPNWRWRAARDLNTRLAFPEDLGEGRNYDNLVVNYILPLLRGYNKQNGSEKDRQQFREKHDGLVWAMENNFDKDKTVAANAIEALLLGGQDYRSIADYLMIDRNAVWWYERTFFDIRSIVDNQMLMNIHVFGPALRTKDPKDYMWKIIGWKHSAGTKALLSRVIPPVGAESIEAMYQQMVFQGMSESAVMATQLREINPYNTDMIVDQFLKMCTDVEDDGSVDSSSKVFSSMLDALQDSFRLADDSVCIPVEHSPTEELAAAFHVRRAELEAENAEIDAEFADITKGDSQ